MARYGEAVFMDAVYLHDVNFSYQLTDDVMVYGGINNLSDEEPFITAYATPVSVRGRYFFMGVNVVLE
ncbi:hypothetical protein [Planctobacterium marinum]|uniref:TonB-dependent receptor n=1 Tax=Planctobacterium marinum TaxID=1631968 RepID=A0AA48HUV4_9ALTE|nr:hypothetical protein MACH26_39200 [Planctobacterium marinum]